ncbi:glucose-1-phosphate thymidylyltransferase RfbA [Spiractinospora alimapuensis]|uniref:glucose-1-phosphate thymidylyltransferase RfbA n=1 Tax=Spiractinospora alimapuensis TaxID=2820884 RepID=UPI001F328DF2|nr:glucose-1-phosphate thymidylyltransferase RfbA [Spiractinospora alimapuensis]QVQ51827.1 glucose-1-phosphate thymidylyltransferase RfbA [Spiractinospora alimapuensis]
MKGIILAGGGGTRLMPVTSTVSKQLLPVFDKPMIYYPLSVLMLANIREVLIICSPDSMAPIQAALGDGSRIGIDISYALQEEPRGIADAYRVGADYVDGSSSALILGDNIFHGPGFSLTLRQAREKLDGCFLFGHTVSDPERYAVGEVDENEELVRIEEKPEAPRANNAITGLYFYDADVVEIARQIQPSPRGELEITDVNQVYLEMGRVGFEPLGRGFTWLDAGTYRSLQDASQYVQMIADRQGIRVACLEEVAARMGFIDSDACYELGLAMRGSEYGRYVMSVAAELG